jgi:hypothetical protein
MIIIRVVFSLAVLALAGYLVVVLSGHLWGRYQEETAALGFGGISERLASQVGVAGPVNAFWMGPPSTPVVREAALEE